MPAVAYHSPMSVHPSPVPAIGATVEVGVVPVDATLAPTVRRLRVTAAQRPFVGDAGFNLDDALRDPLSDAMAILAGGQVIGFYRLDRAPNAVTGRALAQPHLGLRAFLVDHRQQGRGLGTLAVRACCDDAARRHPRHRLLALTVNCRNHAAIATYRRAGFEDSGELFHGGDAGPQHLLLYRLTGHPHDPSPDLPQAPAR